MNSKISAQMFFLEDFSILKTHFDIVKLVYGVFLIAKASLCRAEQGVCFCIIVQGVGDQLSPQLVKRVGQPYGSVG